MEIHRFYFNDGNLSPGKILELPPGETHHLSHVLRVRPGTIVHIFNGSGGEVEAVVMSAEKNGVFVRITKPADTTDRVMEPALSVELALPLLKSDKLETVLRMATELGAAGFCLYHSNRSIPKPDPAGFEKKRTRWEKIILDSVRISGRRFLPPLHEPCFLERLLEQRAAAGPVILAWEGEGYPHLTNLLSSLAPLSEEIKRLCLVTGPEGGFPREEVEQAENRGVYVCSLGPRILRAETAPIAALAAIMNYSGEM